MSDSALRVLLRMKSDHNSRSSSPLLLGCVSSSSLPASCRLSGLGRSLRTSESVESLESLESRGLVDPLLWWWVLSGVAAGSWCGAGAAVRLLGVPMISLIMRRCVRRSCCLRGS
eukprot:5013416-Pyramimonas_sp.AAC.1